MITTRLALLAAVCTASASALATPVTVSNVYQYLDNRGPSDVGFSAGERVGFGASTVIPNGSGGTTGYATNIDYLNGAPVGLVYQAQIVGSNEFAGGLSAAVAPRTPWTLTFRNGGDQTVVTTPDILAATKVGYARNVAISGTSTPTFSWAPALGQSFNGVRLNFYNLDVRVNGLATLFQSVNLQSPTASQFTVPTSWGLTAGTRYSVEVGLIQTRDGTSNLAQTNLLSRSRSYFDFVLLDDPLPGPVYLPTVTAGSGSQPYIFSFNVAGVSNDSVTYIDPEVAIGYDYRVGAGDPNFASVVLPDVGDGVYDISLWDGSAWVFARHANAGETVDLGSGGVSAFRVTGIETSANIAPNDATAFVTGLTFTGAGNFTGTMIPIVAVPEPATWALWIGGTAALLLRRRPSTSRRPRT